MCWEMTKRQRKVMLVVEIKSCFLETNPWIMAELQEQHTIRAQKIPGDELFTGEGVENVFLMLTRIINIPFCDISRKKKTIF